MGLSSVDNTEVVPRRGRSVTTERNGIAISDCRRRYTLRHSRRDSSGSDPLRGVVLEAGNRLSPPRIYLAIREENVAGVHVPSTINTIEGLDVGSRGDRPLRESVQTISLDVFLGQEL